MMEAESLHRVAKMLLDNGEAATVQEAYQTFAQYGVQIALGPKVAVDPRDQIIALTVINTAARTFQGNVVVTADDFRLTVAGFEGQLLSTFLNWLGLDSKAKAAPTSWPVIHIGALPHTEVLDASIRVWADGWTFGIGAGEPKSTSLFPPACVAAAGLAMSEAFSVLRRDNPYAGRRTLRLSLWPSGLRQHSGIPPTDALSPPSTWLLGLGHLGQAYAWTLGFMKPQTETRLYLQDVDTVSTSTISTSVLSTVADLGKMKTRVVAKWLEERGYQTALVERRYDELQKIGPAEPKLAIFGVDNAAARRIMESTGFRFIVDAGLGSGYENFRAIRMRTFPGPSRADSIWAAIESTNSDNMQAPAYKALLAEGADACGVATLATRAVGAPFVGCVAAGYVIAELIRKGLGGPTYGFIDMNLRNPDRLNAA